MRFYEYISERKVSMLFPQLDPGPREKRAGEFWCGDTWCFQRQDQVGGRHPRAGTNREGRSHRKVPKSGGKDRPARRILEALGVRHHGVLVGSLLVNGQHCLGIRRLVRRNKGKTCTHARWIGETPYWAQR